MESPCAICDLDCNTDEETEPPVETVWFGHCPVMVTFAPATSEGVVGSLAALNVPLLMLLALVVSVVALEARPVTPLAGIDVAAIEPVPVAESDAPEPTIKAPLLLVPPPRDGKLPLLHGMPASTMFPLTSHLAQLLVAPAAVALANFEPVPVALVEVKAVAGRREADRVPLVMLPALVVSEVAEGARPVTPLAGTEVAAMVPLPVTAKLAPEPISMAAAVLVPLVRLENAELPPPDPLPVPQGAPESIMLPLASHLAQLLAVTAPVELAVLAPVPVKVRSGW